MKDVQRGTKRSIHRREKEEKEPGAKKKAKAESELT
jgi:hypothetical protein